MTFMDEEVSGYLTELAELAHPSGILDEMEAHAREHGFPIVGRSVGGLLELLTRAVGGRRVMELGSGYGYSAYWFARAVGADGEVVCSDGDPGNAARAEGYLAAAGLWERVRYRVGDAVEALSDEEGDFDVVYCDVDKHGYPDSWRAARERIRVGGLYLCDNVLWGGRVATGGDREGMEGWTAAIQEHNRLVTTDDRYVSSIAPVRDGVLLALRVR
jgi:caffeoyl-CoA O-methyltransferase